MGWLGPPCHCDRRSLCRAFQLESQIKPFLPTAKAPRLPRLSAGKAGVPRRASRQSEGLGASPMRQERMTIRKCHRLTLGKEITETGHN
jgi:hypothetical protein